MRSAVKDVQIFIPTNYDDGGPLPYGGSSLPIALPFGGITDQDAVRGNQPWREVRHRSVHEADRCLGGFSYYAEEVEANEQTAGHLSDIMPSQH